MGNAGENQEMKKSGAKARKLLTAFWPVILIVFLVAAFSFPYLFKGKVPFPADYLVNAFPPWQYYYGLPVKNNAMPDVVTQMYPWKHLAIGLWKAGQIPLWNPNNFSGTPFLANYQSAVFHPANFLFFVLPEIDAWSLMIFLQPLLAGLFTYFFARQINLGKMASFLAAVSFAFCGFMTCWLAYGTMAFALLWLPLILYGIEKSFSKISFLAVFLISFPLVFSFFSGHFQISLYVLGVSLAYLFFKILTTGKWSCFLVSLLAIALGVGLAAVQLLPTFELYRLSVRSQGLGVSEIIPWRYSPTLLAPDFYGNPVTRNDWFGHYAEWSGFTGALPLLLAFYALFGLFKKRDKKVFFFSLIAVFAFLLARPTPLLDFLVKLKIPVLANSAAARINSVFSFSIAILAGFGFDKLRKRLDKDEVKGLLGLAFFGVLLVFCLWAILLFKKPFEPQGILIAKRNFILPSGMISVFALLVLVSWAVSRFLGRYKLLAKWLKQGILVVVLLLSFFDLLRFAQKWMPFDSRQHVYPKLPVLEFLTKRVGYHRVFGYFGMEVQNFFQIQSFGGYEPLYIARYGELLMAASSEGGKIGSPSTRGASLGRRAEHTVTMLNLLNGKYVLHAVDDDHYSWTFNFWDYPEQFKRIYQDEKYEVYENLKVFPRAFMVYKYHLRSDPQEIIDLMFSPEFDLRAEVSLEEKPDLAEEVKPPQNPSRVEIDKFDINHIKMTAETDTTGILFISENYYPGWQALVDGRPTKVYRADYSFRSIIVPAGTHKIDFIYNPLSFKIGLLTSLVSLAILISFGFLLSKRKI